MKPLVWLDIHSLLKEAHKHAPIVQEALCVNTGEEASKVLVKNTVGLGIAQIWRGKVGKVFDGLEKGVNVTTRKVVGITLGDELVEEFGHDL